MVLTDRQRWVKTIHALANGGVKPEVSTDLPDVIIPARNESRTIGQVVKACVESGAVGRVIVVDNDSTDDTALIAKRNGAKAASNSRQPCKDVRVIPCPYIGKGQAVTTGLRHVTSDRLILIDADLINLSPVHVKTLANDTSGMVCWVVDVDQLGAKAWDTKSGSGTRSMPTSLARSIELIGYHMEGALNWSARSQLVKIEYRELPTVCQWWVPFFAEYGRLPKEMMDRGFKNYV